jgi:hypothetical protein
MCTSLHLTSSYSASYCSKRTHLFQVIGQFLAKALLDSRIIDMSLNKIFLKLVLEEEVPQTIASLKVTVEEGLKGCEVILMQ